MKTKAGWKAGVQSKAKVNSRESRVGSAPVLARQMITGRVPCLAVRTLASAGRRHGLHKAKGRSILQAAGSLE